MADPISIGALVAAALAMGAESTIKTGVEEAVKDAYQTLKAAVSKWAGRDVEALEISPTSTTRKAVIAEIIDNIPNADQESIKTIAKSLIQAMRQNGPVGMELKHLTALEADFSNLDVVSGTGVRIENAKVDVFKASNMKVGHTPGK